MKLLSERGAEILEAAVDDFIEFGEPISSGWLYERHDFGIRPAMIRLELENLSDDGYLKKPHYSSGRIPENKGYEFYVRRILENRDACDTMDKKLGCLFREGDWDCFSQTLSDKLGALSVINESSEKGKTHKEGLLNFIENFEWETKNEIEEIIGDFERIDSYFQNRIPPFPAIVGIPSIFIGDSPFTRSPNISVVAGNYDLGGRKINILAIGPKRMNYKKAVKIFRGLNKNGRTSKNQGRT